MSNPIYDQLRDEQLMDDVPATGYPPTAAIRAPREFTHPDGTVYRRADPTDFPDCDDVDSTLIDDLGAPA